jgi:hypothetical protein
LRIRRVFSENPAPEEATGEKG